jgi:pantetheine-phosphate adenylyltransferase
MKRIAICPGSFDPVTFGHCDIITRASALFDKVIVVIAVNSSKRTYFTATERMVLLEKVTSGLENVVIDVWDGLIADYVRNVGAVAIVKGLRAVSDFEYEFQLALANKMLYAGAETIFLTTSAENMYLSSSVVKEIGTYGGDISQFVPKIIIEDIKERLEEKRRQNITIMNNEVK